jgi:predicted nucleic acid-binding protein
MIVVDTNTIAYLYLPSDFTKAVETLLQKDPIWAAPLLWRSEFNNILAVYLRRGLLDFPQATSILTQAGRLLSENEYELAPFEVLELAHSSGCSANDCEFVYLARILNTRLITADKQLLQRFPDTALKASEFPS